MLVVIHPDKGQDSAKAWSGLFISTMAFGDASLKINCNIATLFIGFIMRAMGIVLVAEMMHYDIGPLIKHVVDAQHWNYL